ncbi:MAG: peptidyl-alpha-hydroxyglycine alpha-amidating lyase family protein [Gemmataceae bacterium]|nr:peptidyl-alpha-hydroxyglycine alpha-amidating lyase family protein [Gemmataceae bacterium]
MNAPLVGQGTFRYRPDPAWDKFPGDGPLGEAVGVATDSRSRVYVFLRSPVPVRVYEADGTPLAAWGEGMITRAHGIAIGPDDTVWLTDDFGHAVHSFTTDGRHKSTLGTPGQPSATGATSIDYRTIRWPGPPFCYPTNLAIAPDGDLFVADGYGNARVHRFSSEGRLIASWGEAGSGPGQFHVVHGIAVDADGTVCVADRENNRLQAFSPEGKHRGDWTGLARPCEVFIDRANGLYYVAELGFRAGRWPGTGSHGPGDAFGRMSVFDRGGKLLSRWGGEGDPTAPGDFFAPHDVWVDGRGDVYVAEVALSGGGRTGLVAPSCHCLQKFVRATGDS